MHHLPGLVHRFYQDLSKLGRHEEDGSLSTTTTMKGCGPFVSAEGLEQLHRFLASLVFFKDV